MRAVLSLEKGPADTLVVGEVEAPTPGPGEIAVDVKAAALNFFDTLIIEDRYQYRPERPFSPGGEMAGVVAAVGDGVAGFAPGDRVVGYLGHGCCRERVVAPADILFHLPDALPFDAASGLIVTYGTSLHALRDRGDLKPGETLAVLGASGGTGQAAVEIGKLMGARVIAAASSEDKLAVALAHGADIGIVYDGASPEGARAFKDALREATSGRGVDVVYDPVGGDLAEAAIRALALKGRYLVVGFTAGIPKIPLNLLLLRGADARGIFWGDSLRHDPAGYRAAIEQLVDWAAAGALRPEIDATFSFDEAAEALRRLSERRAKGKIVLLP